MSSAICNLVYLNCYINSDKKLPSYNTLIVSLLQIRHPNSNLKHPQMSSHHYVSNLFRLFICILSQLPLKVQSQSIQCLLKLDKCIQLPLSPSNKYIQQKPLVSKVKSSSIAATGKLKRLFPTPLPRDKFPYRPRLDKVQAPLWQIIS